MLNGATLAALALVPLMAGTVPHDASATADAINAAFSDAITVSLCNGGTITLDLALNKRGDKDTPVRDCTQKACHAGACREKEKSKANRTT